MKKIIRYLPIIAFFVLTASRVFAQNVSVKDYRVPVSTSDRLLIDLSLNHDVKAEEVTTSRGNIGGVYKRFYNSLPFGYSVDIIGAGAANRDIAEKKYNTDYQINGAGRVQKYLLPNHQTLKDIFASVRLDTNMVKSFDRPASAATIGLGYGRFIQATPLAKAVRIEEFLIDEGEIKGHLPPDVILELSDIIARQEEYLEKHGVNYKKTWYGDMETIMREAGILTANALGAIGVLRIDEVIERERIADRFYGWDVTFGTKFDITLSDASKTRPPANLDLSTNYARPISWQWQVNERFSMSTPFNNLGKAFLTSLSSDISYELSNRVDFRLQHLIRVDKPKGETAQISNSLGISFIYYIENHINLIATEQLEKVPGKDLTTNFSIALNYRVF